MSLAMRRYRCASSTSGCSAPSASPSGTNASSRSRRPPSASPLACRSMAALTAHASVYGCASPRTRRDAASVRSARLRAAAASPSAARSLARLLCHAEGVRVLRAEHVGHRVERVLVQRPRLRRHAGRAQDDRDVGRRHQGQRVPHAEVAAVPVQRVHRHRPRLGGLPHSARPGSTRPGRTRRRAGTRTRRRAASCPRRRGRAPSAAVPTPSGWSAARCSCRAAVRCGR